MKGKRNRAGLKSYWHCYTMSKLRAKSQSKWKSIEHVDVLEERLSRTKNQVNGEFVFDVVGLGTQRASSRPRVSCHQRSSASASTTYRNLRSRTSSPLRPWRCCTAPLQGRRTSRTWRNLRFTRIRETAAQVKASSKAVSVKH